MKITVSRFLSDDDSTLSTVSVDGKFACFGLEDEYRSEKVPKETRIPAGAYRVGLRTVGGFHNRYRRKFRSFHRGMLHVQDVPGFTHILIHVGNTDADTAGCLLVGTGATARVGDISVQSSVEAYRRLYQEVMNAAAEDTLEMEFIDDDRQE